MNGAQTGMGELAVRDAMTHLVVAFRPRDKIPYATKRLLSNRISGAPVVEDGRVVGVVSEADLVKAYVPRTRRASRYPTHPMVALLQGGPRNDVSKATVGDVMTTNVVSIGPDEGIFEAAAVIDHHGVRRLPVTDAGGCLVGIVARSDLVRCMARAFGSLQGEARSSLA